MWIFWQLFNWTWANWTIFFFLIGNHRHVSQQNSINVCTSTKKLVFLWFLFWEAPDLGTYCQKLCKVTAFIKSLALWVGSLELYTVHVFSVADIVFACCRQNALPRVLFFFFFLPPFFKTNACKLMKRRSIFEWISSVLGLPHPRTPVVSIKAGTAATAWEYQWP